MSNECKDKIQEDEARSSQDYRLNFKLREACASDAEHLCGNLCQVSLGAALSRHWPA